MSDVVDVVGIGVGPANLSLAALLHPHRSTRSLFFERAGQFQWHAGLMFPEAVIQVPYIKDLVSMVDPTSRFSFLSFLSQTGRLYSFVNANFPQVLRREFSEYYAWVCRQLCSVHFNSEIEAVTADESGLTIHSRRGLQRTRHVVLGTGLTPAVPGCVQSKLCGTVFHASEYRYRNARLAGRRVIVLGGGQTGAEILLHILSDSDNLPSEVYWVSRRSNFLPLDETPFTNELFTPAYSDYFFHLPPGGRRQLLAEQKLASDGISASLLEAIYRRLYQLRYCERGGCQWHLLPGREAKELTRRADGWRLTLRHEPKNTVENIVSDCIVLCTGYAARLPPYLEPIRDRIRLQDGAFTVNSDYSIVWDGPPGRNIYVQNAARIQRGIADPNLSLIAWRSAKIANSLTNHDLYKVQGWSSFVTWDAEEDAESRQLDNSVLSAPTIVGSHASAITEATPAMRNTSVDDD